MGKLLLVDIRDALIKSGLDSYLKLKKFAWYVVSELISNGFFSYYRLGRGLLKSEGSYGLNYVW